MIDIQALFIEHPERKLGACKKNILPEEIVMEQQTKLDHIASLVLTLVGLKMQNCWKYLSICFWLWLSNSPVLLTKSLFFSPPGPLFQTPALFLIPEPNNWGQQKCQKIFCQKSHISLSTSKERVVKMTPSAVYSLRLTKGNVIFKQLASAPLQGRTQKWLAPQVLQ